MPKLNENAPGVPIVLLGLKEDLRAAVATTSLDEVTESEGTPARAPPGP